MISSDESSFLHIGFPPEKKIIWLGQLSTVYPTTCVVISSYETVLIM